MHDCVWVGSERSFIVDYVLLKLHRSTFVQKVFLPHGHNFVISAAVCDRIDMAVFSSMAVSFFSSELASFELASFFSSSRSLVPFSVSFEFNVSLLYNSTLPRR